MAPGAEAFVPQTRRLTRLAEAARSCRGCTLHRNATQTVFGVGRHSAKMMLIGEQPGDREDLAGTPFVGPAGQLLDKALAAADIDRDAVYVTNAVKHFKFSRAAGSKRRIHKKPTAREVVACRPWLMAELAAVAPNVVVLLGATAAKALLGNDFRLTAHRGEVLRLPAAADPPQLLRSDPDLVPTAHPSSVLRGPAAARDQAFARLVTDLSVAAKLLRD